MLDNTSTVQSVAPVPASQTPGCVPPTRDQLWDQLVRRMNGIDPGSPSIVGVISCTEGRTSYGILAGVHRKGPSIVLECPEQFVKIRENWTSTGDDDVSFPTSGTPLPEVLPDGSVVIRTKDTTITVHPYGTVECPRPLGRR